jgi:hypothetical protein
MMEEGVVEEHGKDLPNFGSTKNLKKSEKI